MSSYHQSSRRAPNVSQYIANLNTIPPAHELASNDISIGDGDLDFLTNAEFFDFDSFNPAPVHHGHAAVATRNQTHSPHNGAHYQFGEFQTYPTPVTPGAAANGLHGHYPPQPNHQLAYGGPNVGDKRKQSSVVASIPSPADLEEQSRMAAEEDKRRRNTAASARFRVKKKQREQALEKQAKEMTEKVQQLEGKVQQLEMENKWLKGLITDKNDGKGLDSLKQDDVAEERKPTDHTTGVGTGEEDEDEEPMHYDALSEDFEEYEDFE